MPVTGQHQSSIHWVGVCCAWPTSHTSRTHWEGIAAGEWRLHLVFTLSMVKNPWKFTTFSIWKYLVFKNKNLFLQAVRFYHNLQNFIHFIPSQFFIDILSLVNQSFSWPYYTRMSYSLWHSLSFSLWHLYAANILGRNDKRSVFFL